MEIDRRTVLKAGALASVFIAGMSQQLAPVDAATTSTAADHPDISHGSRSKKQVALTFHGAGSAKLADRILAIVKEHQVGISVMAVGTWLEASPGMARAVLDAGHDLGNHTMHHKPMRTLSAKEAYTEIQQGALLLDKLIGSKGSWFRPSGVPHSTAQIRTAARKAGYPYCVTYDVDSLDYTDPKPSKIVSNTLDHVKSGSIISLHFGHANTPLALPALIEGLAKRHLQPVTLTTLLGK